MSLPSIKDAARRLIASPRTVRHDSHLEVGAAEFDALVAAIAAEDNAARAGTSAIVGTAEPPTPAAMAKALRAQGVIARAAKGGFRVTLGKSRRAP